MIEIGTMIRTWEVIALARPYQGRPRWLCRCTCGNEKLILNTHLECDMYLHCACTPAGKRYSKKVKPGDKFGHWTVLSEIGVINKRRHWRVQCVCGKVKESGVDTAHLTCGLSKSCGCRGKGARKG